MNGLKEQWSEALAAAPHGPAPAWLRDLRESAAGQVRAAGLPHRKVEAWKYTPMAVFDGLRLSAAEPREAPQPDLPAPLCEAPAMVDIRDGVPGELPADLPRGLTVLPLEAGLERFEDRLQPLFGAVDLQGATRAFAALNTALARQGLVVHVAAGCESARLLLRWGFSAGAAETMSHFRLFVLLDDGARLDLVEQFLDAGEAAATGTTGLNVLCQAELGTGASFSHTRVQAASEQAVLLTSTTAVSSTGVSTWAPGWPATN